MRPYTESNSEQDEILLPTKDGFVVIPAPQVRKSRLKTQPRQRQPVRQSGWSRSNLSNFLHFTAMLLAMIAISGYLGYAIGGLLGFSVRHYL